MDTHLRKLMALCFVVALVAVAAPVSVPRRAVAYNPNAAITISPTSGPPGTQVTVWGTDFTPLDTIQFYLGSDPYNPAYPVADLGYTYSDESGSFAIYVTIPSDFPAGNYRIWANDQDDSGADAAFIITGQSSTSIDLEVLDIAVVDGSIACAGDSAAFEARFRNNGSMDSGNFNFRWIADGQVFDGGYGMNGEYWTLGPGASGTQPHLWENLQSGSHTLTFIVDMSLHGPQVPETNEANNERTFTFEVENCTVEPSPAEPIRIEIESVSVTPDQIEQGQSATILVTPKLLASTTRRVRIEVRNDLSGQRLSSEQDVKTLVPHNTQVHYSFDFPTDDSTEVGIHTFTVTAYDDDDEHNNIADTETANIVVHVGDEVPGYVDTTTVRVHVMCLNLSATNLLEIARCHSARLDVHGMYDEPGIPEGLRTFRFDNVPVENLGGHPAWAKITVTSDIGPCLFEETVNNHMPSFWGAYICKDPVSTVSAFSHTQSRTDQPVADGTISRTWMWGPEPHTDIKGEKYLEGAEGYRIVQYYDKSRMEITHPDGDPNSAWYVTNGLLATELITGNMQLGDNTFEQYFPVEINVGGDADDPTGPTYRTFNVLRGYNPFPVNGILTQRISRDSQAWDDVSLSRHGVTAAYLDTVTNHTVASPFWEYMNSSGLIYENGQYVTAQLFENPFYATGRPITEAYWTNIKVNGQYKDVLIQCFERRCLTHTPDNPDGWKVEAGNVGQHYYQWRYGD